MIKYHIGCGKRDFGPDWVHVDGEDYPHVLSNDVCLHDRSPQSASIIYCSHMIEYFDRDELVTLLRLWHGHLLPGGILRISVPDFSKIVKLYIEQYYTLDSLLGLLYGKMKLNGKNVYHKTVFDYKSLEFLLLSVGFESVTEYDWRTTEHSHIDDHSQAYLPHMQKTTGTLMSLNVEAIKPIT